MDIKLVGKATREQLAPVDSEVSGAGKHGVLALNTSHSVQEPLKICREEYLANSFDPLGYCQTSLSEALRFCSFVHF